MGIAFVLQGGGGLAAAQVGQLRALWECGITPDLVVGASAGAINAVAFTQDPSEESLNRLERAWTRLRAGDILPTGVFSLVSSLPSVVTGLLGWHDGVLSARPLRRLIERNVDVTHLEDTQVPVHVVATDLASGQPTVLSTGRAADALLASTALPGVFPPVEIAGRPLIDGGVSVGTPIRQAESLGATVTYMLPTVGSTPPQHLPRGAVPMLLRAVSQLLGHVSAADLQTALGELHVLPGPSRAEASPFDLGSAAELIAAGYDEAMAALRGGPPDIHGARRGHRTSPPRLNGDRAGAVPWRPGSWPRSAAGTAPGMRSCSRTVGTTSIMVSIRMLRMCSGRSRRHDRHRVKQRELTRQHVRAQVRRLRPACCHLPSHRHRPSASSPISRRLATASPLMWPPSRSAPAWTPVFDLSAASASCHRARNSSWSV